MNRRKSREVKIGSVKIGGGNPIAVQSMTNTKTSDFEATFKQVRSLSEAGCDIVRIAVPQIECAPIFSYIKEKGIDTPLVADIHFDYKIALACVDCGVDKIRINPGNIGADDRIKAVADACAAHGIPIRVGVNSGSLEKKVLEEHGEVNAEALAESALDNIRLLERFGYEDIVVAAKSSDVPTMLTVNEILAEQCECPIHLGVTEAGSPSRGIIKSSVGIGSLLTRGIGDTIRVSLTADPIEEVRAAKAILEYCGLAENDGIEVVSCPTCGRTNIDLIGLVSEFERRIPEIKRKGALKVALMGCVVNGPGEAREADIGIAGGIGEALIFKHGEPLYKVSDSHAVDALIDEINRM